VRALRPGHDRCQYDVWGDTVNLAARLEHAAAPGALCVTAETWRALEPYCLGASLGALSVKGKGDLELFRVDAIRG